MYIPCYEQRGFWNYLGEVTTRLVRSGLDREPICRIVRTDQGFYHREWDPANSWHMRLLQDVEHISQLHALLWDIRSHTDLR